MHCPKCMIRSGLWKPEQWPDLANVPSLAETMKAHGELKESIPEVQDVIDYSNTKRLY